MRRIAQGDGTVTTGYQSVRVTNNAVTDSDAGPGGAYAGQLSVFQPTLITVGGKAVFGTDYMDYDRYFSDAIHYAGLGQDPSRGLAAVVNDLIAA